MLLSRFFEKSSVGRVAFRWRGQAAHICSRARSKLLVRGLDDRTLRPSIFAEANLGSSVRVSSITIIKTPPFGEVFIMVAGAGLEPTTSWL